MNEQQPAERTRRDRLTEEEVARACDRLVAAGERVTIAKVRQQVGGGGNQTVIQLVAKWREQEAKAQAAGTLDEQLSDSYRQALLGEMRRHRELGEQQLQAQRDELQELCEVLHRDLTEAHERGEEASSRGEQLAEELAELRAKSSEHKEVAEARLEDAVARAEELAQALRAANDATEHHRLEVARVHGDHQAQSRLCERLDAELSATRQQLQAARREHEQAARDAAVATAQLAGEREIVVTIRGRIDQLQRDLDKAAERQRAMAARLQVRRQRMKGLRQKLQEATAAHSPLSAPPAAAQLAPAEASPDAQGDQPAHESAAFAPPARVTAADKHPDSPRRRDDTRPSAPAPH